MKKKIQLAIVNFFFYRAHIIIIIILADSFFFAKQQQQHAKVIICLNTRCSAAELFCGASVHFPTHRAKVTWDFAFWPSRRNVTFGSLAIYLKGRNYKIQSE
jgi:hypothetical protein